MLKAFDRASRHGFEAVFDVWLKNGWTGTFKEYPGAWYVRRMVRRAEARVNKSKGN